MLQLSPNTRYWLYRHHADMRSGFDSLCGIVTNEMEQSALSGDVFVFLNRRRTHVKLLVWEGDGLALYYKRLENGTYEQPVSGNENAMRVTARQLMLMLQGISLKQVKYRRRYQHYGQKCA